MGFVFSPLGLKRPTCFIIKSTKITEMTQAWIWKEKTGPLFQLSPKSSGHTGHGAGVGVWGGDAARVQIKAKSHSVRYEDGGR